MRATCGWWWRSDDTGIGIPPRCAATAVPGVRPGGWLDLPPVRRQRAWPGDQPATGRAHGWVADRQEHTRGSAAHSHSRSCCRMRPVDDPGIAVATFSAVRHTASAARPAGRGQRDQSPGCQPHARAHGPSCRHGRRRVRRRCRRYASVPVRAGPDGCDDAGDGRPDRHQADPQRARRNGCTPIIGLTASAEPRQRGGLSSRGHGWLCQQAGDRRAPCRRAIEAVATDACVAVIGRGCTGPYSPMTSALMAWPT